MRTHKQIHLTKPSHAISLGSSVPSDWRAQIGLRPFSSALPIASRDWVPLLPRQRRLRDVKDRVKGTRRNGQISSRLSFYSLASALRALRVRHDVSPLASPARRLRSRSYSPLAHTAWKLAVGDTIVNVKPQCARGLPAPLRDRNIRSRLGRLRPTVASASSFGGSLLVTRYSMDEP